MKNFGHFNELDRAEQEKLSEAANHGDLAVLVFCASLLIGWLIGSLAGWPV